MEFLERKIRKKWFIKRGTCLVLMWRREHVSMHQQANWTGTDPRERLRGAMAKWGEYIGPMGRVGLVSGIVRGGLLGPMGDTKDFGRSRL